VIQQQTELFTTSYKTQDTDYQYNTNIQMTQLPMVQIKPQ